MNNSYMTDVIDVINESKDINGAVTRVVTENVMCRINGKRELKATVNGKELMSSFNITLNKDVILNAESKIKIKKIKGADYLYSSKEFMIISYSEGHNSVKGHNEIWV